MKKTEIAANVFALTQTLTTSPISDGALTVPVADLSALAMVPWFCEVSVQWAVRVSDPTKALDRKFMEKMQYTYPSVVDGKYLIGFPGDGLEPSYQMPPFAAALAKVVKPGMKIELGTANFGRVKRDYEVKAESETTNGNQLYSGTVNDAGEWVIEQSSPAVTRYQLQTALDCARLFTAKGPWEVKDRTEAEGVLMIWLQSYQANINPHAVRTFVTLKGNRFEHSDRDGRVGIDRKLYGLALGFFRYRLANGPYKWAEREITWQTPEDYKTTVEKVLGASAS